MKYGEFMEVLAGNDDGYQYRYWVFHLPPPRSPPRSSCWLLNELPFLFRHQRESWYLFRHFADEEHEPAITAHASTDEQISTEATYAGKITFKLNSKERHLRKRGLLDTVYLSKVPGQML